MVNQNKITDRYKKQFVFNSTILILIILVFNVLAGIFHKRFDLTEDKRFTISEPTQKLLKSIKEVVFIKIYLTGDKLPAGVQRLSDASKEMLDEFRTIAGDKIQYEFINPDNLGDQTAKKEFYSQIASKGLRPTQLQVNEDNEFSERIIVPGAMVSMAGKEVSAILMQSQRGNVSPEEELNSSVSQLEYQFASSIKKLITVEKKKIAIIQGHKEAKPIFLSDISNSLREYYDVDFLDLPSSLVERLQSYQAIIIAKPDSVFSEIDKFKLDQYLVKGGNVLLCIDNLTAEMDSIQATGEGFTGNKNLQLEDLLIKYGLRLGYDIVEDANCHFIPLLRSNFGNQQRGSTLKWPFYPVVTPSSDHPIVNSLPAIWFKFPNSIDTLNVRDNQGLRKTILLNSSTSTRVVQHPAQISLKMVQNLDPRMFQSGIKNLAVLVEGKFNSAFRNRVYPEKLKQIGITNYEAQGKKSAKLILVSDGDIILNGYSSAYQRPFQLGFDPYTNQLFANKSFIMNCIDYMVDDEGLISLRSKQFKLRLLNASESKKNAGYYKFLNTVIPILALILFGIIFNYIRKRRFAS